MSKPIKPSWSKYFLSLCDVIATRSSCDRLSVGAVIVGEDNQIISTGYNGALRGMPECNENGHLMIDGHCRNVVHSETNAIAQAARHGISVKNSTIYCNFLPCLECYKLIAAAGISNIVYREKYGNSNITEKLASHSNSKTKLYQYGG